MSPQQKIAELSYALNKQVPDMLGRGFTIETAYGAIVVAPDHHAQAIAAVVRRVLEVQLKAAELAQRDAELDARQA